MQKQQTWPPALLGLPFQQERRTEPGTATSLSLCFWNVLVLLGPKPTTQHVGLEQRPPTGSIPPWKPWGGVAACELNAKDDHELAGEGPSQKDPQRPQLVSEQKERVKQGHCPGQAMWGLGVQALSLDSP